MNTADLIKDLENTARFCMMEAATAKRVDMQLAARYAKMANTFGAAADEARELQKLCVEAITQRITKPPIQKY